MIMSAQAEVITQTFNYGPATPNYNGTATFNQYSGAIGTLTQVVIRVTLTADNFKITADNDGANPISGAASLGTSNTTTLKYVDPEDPEGFVSITTKSLITTNTVSISLSADDGDGEGVQTTGTDWVEFYANGLQTETTAIYKTNLQRFTDYGTLFWDYNVGSYYNVTGGPSMTLITGKGGGQLQISYYTTIPEPATASILAIAGLAFVVRRRRLYSLPV